jgi:hypothetical protein
VRCPDAKPDADTDAYTDADTDAYTDADTDAEPDTVADTDTNPDADPDTDPNPDADPDPDADADPDSVADAESVAHAWSGCAHGSRQLGRRPWEPRGAASALTGPSQSHDQTTPTVSGSFHVSGCGDSARSCGAERQRRPWVSLAPPASGPWAVFDGGVRRGVA